jgi:scyllo-inositol 2-dehydrogenase (NADP+)
MDAKLGVGLLGYGLAGEFFHAPLIVAEPRLELRAIVTADPERAARAARLATVVASPDAVLRDPAIDLVVVATPNDTHHALAGAALRAGRHVVVDKPLAADVAQADDLITLADRAGRVLVPFHNRRWDGDFLTVRAVIASGRLGRIVRYEAWWDRFRTDLREGWKDRAAPGAGIHYDLGSHLIDQLLVLFGAPDEIDADVAAMRTGSPIVDHVEIRGRYRTGLRVALGATMLGADPRPRFAVHGTRGSFVKFGVDPQEAQLRAGRRPGDPDFGVEAAASAGTPGTFTVADGTREPVPTHRGDYTAFYAGVAAAVLDGAPVPVDAADARRGLELIALAERSAGEGRRVRVNGWT